MKRFMAVLTVLILFAGVAVADTTWQELTTRTVNATETVIKEFRKAYWENGGSLSDRDVELFYRFFMLRISAMQVRAASSVGFGSILIEGANADAYAEVMGIATDMWRDYVSGKGDKKALMDFLIMLTDEVEK